MLERELKALLDVNQYELLLDLFEWNDKNTQINYYYAKKDIKNEITIRIRAKNNKYVLQIKVAIPNSYTDKIEFEKEVTHVLPSIDSNTIKSISNIVYKDVYLIGALVTQRNTLFWSKGVTVYLDRNEYLGMVDYELEIEYENHLPIDLRELLAEKNIVFNEKPLGKYSRFISERYDIRTNIK